MSSSNQVVFEFIGNDQVSSVISSIGSSMEGMSMSAYTALQDVGSKAQEISQQIVQAASDAEQGWIAFSNGLSNVGGGNLATAKTEVVSLANELGRSTGDVRSFETTMMNMGASVETAEAGVRAASAAAAGSGKDFTTVQSAIVSAMKGRGAALKELGFDINNYKDAETGAIDTTRLYADIQAKFSQAQGQYANSFVANNQKLTNALNGLKSDLGSSAMSLENVFIPALTSGVNGLRALPAPIKAVAGVGVEVVGTFVGMSAEIANVVKAGEGILTVFNSAKDIIQGFSSATKVAEATTTTLTLAELANESAEIQAAAAHAGTGTIYAGETVAKEADTAATWGLAAANWSLLGPILIVIAIIGLLVAAVYEAGKSMGWWSDFGGMVSVAMTQLGNVLKAVWSVIQPILVLLGTLVIKYFQLWYLYIQFIIQIILTAWGVISGVASAVISVIATVVSVIMTILTAIQTYIITPVQQMASIVQSAFSSFASAVNTVLGPLKSVYDKVVSIVDKAKELGGGIISWITGQTFGGEDALIDSQEYHAMLQSKGITAQVGNTSNTQTVQFNIDSVDVSANNLSPSEAKNVMITALESLNNVEGIKLKRRTV